MAGFVAAALRHVEHLVHPRTGIEERARKRSAIAAVLAARDTAMHVQRPAREQALDVDALHSAARVHLRDCAELQPVGIDVAGKHGAVAILSIPERAFGRSIERLAPADLGDIDLGVLQIDRCGDSIEVAAARAGRAQFKLGLALHEVARGKAKGVEQVRRRTGVGDELGLAVTAAHGFPPFERDRARGRTCPALPSRCHPESARSSTRHRQVRSLPRCRERRPC